jgi:hypothetical protein
LPDKEIKANNRGLYCDVLKFFERFMQKFVSDDDPYDQHNLS